MQETTLTGDTAEKRQQITAVLIANPTAGSLFFHSHHLESVVQFLRAQGWQVDLHWTTLAGEARRLAAEAVTRGIHVVIAGGGDGTINEVIQELAGTETALGVLPLGTVNIWAREVGIPLDIAGAQRVLVEGQIRHVDLGKLDDRYFLLMAGIGMDGEITHAVERKPAKRLGVLGYLLVGTWLGLGYPAYRAAIEVDGLLFKTNALQIVIGNTQLYAGAIKYTWQARCNDGLLDLCIVRKQGMFGRILVALDFLLGREQRRQWVRYETSKAIKIFTRKPVAIQIDGEPMGYTPGSAAPTTVTIAPRVLKAIVPRHTSEDLFTSEKV